MSLINPIIETQTWYEEDSDIKSTPERFYVDVIFSMNDVESVNMYVDDDFIPLPNCSMVRFRSGISFAVTLPYSYLADKFRKCQNVKICFN
jgi:hypothetical protein